MRSEAKLGSEGAAEAVCEGCGAELRKAARYCPNCGREVGSPSQAASGPVHRNPLRPPTDMCPITSTMDLYFRVESAWGGSRLGSESLALSVMSCGHSLESAVLEISGIGGPDGRAFRVRQEVERLPRGEMVRVEVPSYELPDEPRELSVALVSADVSRNTQ